ncbi:MAG: hypothetical protein HS111_36130 [Kofleriaceae bacterium]|nr:hypothetical protein [Kofleriaceae bacterium]
MTRLLAADAPAHPRATPGGAGAAGDGPTSPWPRCRSGRALVVAAEAAGGLGPGQVPAGLARLDGAAWPELAAALAAPTAADVAAFAAVARAHVVDPALAERHAEDVLAPRPRRRGRRATAGPSLRAARRSAARARAVAARRRRRARRACARPRPGPGHAADAGDPAAGLLAMTRAAAAWGDAAHAYAPGACGATPPPPATRWRP